MIKRRLKGLEQALLIAGMVGMALPVAAQTTTLSSDSSPKPTTVFLKEATRNNSMEAALAEVGVRRAQNPQLKAFAQQVQQDHLKSNEALKPIDQQHGVNIDEPLPKADLHELARIEKENGSKFDKDLATKLLREHQRSLREYQRASQENLPTDVKDYAQNRLPVLQDHFARAQTVAKDVGVSQATITSISSEVTPAMGGTGTAQEFPPAVGAGQKNEKGAGAKQLEQQRPIQQQPQPPQ